MTNHQTHDNNNIAHMYCTVYARYPSVGDSVASIGGAHS